LGGWVLLPIRFFRSLNFVRDFYHKISIEYLVEVNMVGPANELTEEEAVFFEVSDKALALGTLPVDNRDNFRIRTFQYCPFVQSTCVQSCVKSFRLRAVKLVDFARTINSTIRATRLPGE
jgi:hypothetical protein